MSGEDYIIITSSIIAFVSFYDLHIYHVYHSRDTGTSQVVLVVNHVCVVMGVSRPSVTS